jgi:hypothetical protein
MNEAQNPPHGRERRRHPRLQVRDLPLSLDDGRALRVRDLSRAGVCIFSEEPIRPMTQVRFRFQLAASAPQEIRGEGVVVRCERLSPAIGHFEVAIFFQELDAGCQERLDRYLLALSAAS